ncbi:MULTISPECIES: J domain-containing protein [Streptomyces]|uniref:J domain-containing protein n=3 Tax=Streptomyces TaxID=1883 RepID=A0ABW2MGU2_9ACTN|nr:MULTISPECIES: J domain-containing protein [Streptomyces]MCL6291233.1 J domain-containing protein [Streptomyces sp. 43Y-GA-1]MCX4710100.1 J domain-containing protein [Streptomyces griseus]MDX2669509.1 J domain-containing protein [Streptomyces sp. NRRL_ISP-5395]MDX3500392.1 J domain-containing protein [Streptomyces sp. ATCC51928]MDX5520453.1 J domain-containing protein [Streptomyces sp. DE06-01C]
MSDEAAGVPTTRNDEDRQDNDRQDSGRTDAPGPAPEAQDAPGAPGDSGAADAAAGEPVGAEDAAPRPEARLARAVQAAEQALIEFEIAVETFRVEVENFSRLHHQKLGPMYTRLDELDALIAEARAARTGDPEDERKAREARAVVMPMPGVDELFHDWMDTDGLSPEAAAMLTEQPVRPPKRVRPSEEARRLYRELARKAHPDLAQDEPERQRRDEFIARVNAAYGRGDIELLKELVAEWEAGPAQPLTPLSESEELYARLEWLSRRKELLTVLAKELEEGAIGSMLRMAPDDPDQLLEDIAEQLLGEVSRREAELAELVQ